MTRAGIAVLAALLAPGCVRYVKVEVPVAVPCPPPQIPAKPVFAIESLPADAPPADSMRALIVSLNQCFADDQQLRTILKGYEPAFVGPPAPAKERPQ